MPGKYISIQDAVSNRSREALDARIAQAKRNLGIGSLFGLLGVLGQDANESIAPLDDSYIDSRIRRVPQYIRDQQSYDIDKTLRTTTQGALSTLSPNRAANIVAVANANALSAKSRLGAQNAMQDIALENQYKDLKNASLSKYNNTVASRLNAIRNNKNAQVQGVGALGTNFYNEMQKSINRVNAIGDQQALTSANLNSLLPYLKLLKI